MGYCSFPHKPILLKKTLTLFISLILLISTMLLSFNDVYASPNEETRNPTSNFGAWFNGINAYTSNDVYAEGQLRNSVHEWSDYGFSLSDVTINEVLIGVEHYVSSGVYAIEVSVYNGSVWSQWSDSYTYESETMLWLNYTDKFEWTAEQVNAIETKVIHRTFGGGTCYPDNMYFVVITNASLLERELLNIKEWNFYNPTQIQTALDENITLYVLSWNEEKEWFIDEDSKIVKVDVHNEGNYTLFDMYSGELEITYLDEDEKNKTMIWESHIELTSEHKIPYSLNGVNWILDTAESVYDYWNNGQTVYVNHLWLNYTLKPFPITYVKKTEKFKENVYNVWTKGDMKNNTLIQYKKGKTLSQQEYDMLMHLKKCGVPIGEFPPFLVVTAKVPYTAYLDWIPVKVTYSELALPICIPCLFIGICTIAGIFLLVLYLLTTEN